MAKKREQWIIELGMRLKLEREQQRLSRANLAELLDFSNEYIAQVERGEKMPSLRSLMKMVNALHIPADYLIFGRAESNTPHQEDTLSLLTDFLKERTDRELDDIFKIVMFLFPYIKK